MTCKSCQLAERTPRSAEFTAGCMSCKARALAGIGGHLASKEAGRVLPEYRETLERLFGTDWKQGAQMVKEWATRMGQSAEPEMAVVAPRRKKA